MRRARFTHKQNGDKESKYEEYEIIVVERVLQLYVRLAQMIRIIQIFHKIPSSNAYTTGSSSNHTDTEYTHRFYTQICFPKSDT